MLSARPLLTCVLTLLIGVAAAGSALPARANGGALRLYLPVVAAPPGELHGYLVLLTSDRDGDQEVYTVRGDGTAYTQLTFDESATGDPLFSPDGSRILYRARDGANEDYLALMNRDGSGAHALTNLPGNEDLAQWSPDGAAIAFRRYDPATQTFDLYYLPLASGEPLFVRANLQTFAWSPDGAQLAYTVARRDGSITYFDLYVYTPATGESLLLVSDTQKSFGWARDGATIAFSAKRENDNELFTVTPDGAEARQLTDNAVDDDFAGWAAHGTRVLFTRALSVLEAPRNIYLIAPDGSGETRLTNSSDFKQVVSIAPDGSAIAYTRVAEGGASQRLYARSIAGGAGYPVSDALCTQTTTLNCGWGMISWAADGRQFAYHQFQRPRPGQPGAQVNEVYLVTLSGNGAQSALANGNATNPLWLEGSPYLLLYTPPPDGGIRVPHTMDARTLTRVPLVGLAEEAYIYDWVYVP